MTDEQILYCVIAFVLGYLLYRHMGNGFSVGGTTKSCKTCAGSLVTTGATAIGIDEIPFVGEAVIGGEAAVDTAACGLCGVNIGEVLGCVKNKTGNINERLCKCDSKLC